MTTAPDRPGRLPVLGHVLLVLLLATSFVSGVLVWWGQTLASGELGHAWWVRPALVMHGCLAPLQCVLFGILLCHHIRVGWESKANRLSGFCAECVFAGLIATGTGLYYAGGEDWLARFLWSHRILGLCFPLVLSWHWWSGLRWARHLTFRQPS